MLNIENDAVGCRSMVHDTVAGRGGCFQAPRPTGSARPRRSRLLDRKGRAAAASVPPRPAAACCLVRVPIPLSQSTRQDAQRRGRNRRLVHPAQVVRGVRAVPSSVWRRSAASHQTAARGITRSQTDCSGATLGSPYSFPSSNLWLHAVFRTCGRPCQCALAWTSNDSGFSDALGVGC